jgi:hypothetical protein
MPYGMVCRILDLVLFLMHSLVQVLPLSILTSLVKLEINLARLQGKATSEIPGFYSMNPEEAHNACYL